ncbi:GW dipeptide domain-containing protein [Pediococcus inopinatus]|uniref:GW dipeptide domain-containing protein n=1 Tax=Pediococcus inopinatus TaxID=114090 RepID=A0ABZ0Q4E6_9LACO|nr:GW dipeptide domain-containing protein [Pediococcus inopinatus]WPC19285.1 GW dipeptide domain-containing protein [Pediococcus inopinatus]WPC21075.1 GW dipeptide domain-containing protein [Pediococcus inopinatus]
MNKTIITAITGAVTFIALGATAAQASTVHKVTGMKNVAHSARVVLNDYRSHNNNKRMYSLIRKNHNNYTMKSVHYIHNFTKFTLIKSAKISGKTYYYVKSPAGYTGWIWNGYLGMNTSYINGSGNVTVNGNTTNFYNHVNQGDYKSFLKHYGHNYRNHRMQINKLAKKSGTSGYYLRVKYNGKTWGWIHQNGVTYKGSKTTYTAINGKPTVTVKTNATNDFYNHVNRGNYLNHLIHFGESYHGKKFTTDMKAKKSGVSGYYYRVYYNGKNYGWIHQNALNTTSSSSNTTSANKVSSSKKSSSTSNTITPPKNGSSSTNANNTSSKPVTSSSSSKASSSSKPTSSSSSKASSASSSSDDNDGYIEPHFDDVNIAEIKKDIVKDINAYRFAQAKQEGVTDLNEQYWSFTENSQLNQAANVRIKEIATENGYSHTRPDGTQFFTAIDQSGYPVDPQFASTGDGTAEILTQGFQCETNAKTAQSFVDIWKVSPNHASIMLNPYKDVGVGVINSKYGLEAVVDFGTPKGWLSPIIQE